MSRILVVEDSNESRELIQAILESAGFEVTSCEGGLEAYELIRNDRYDLVILDLMLPQMDGFHVCRLIKFDKKLKDIPVIISSAKSEEEDQKLGYEVGADAFIKKPIDADLLLETIKKFTENVVQEPES